MSEPSAPRDLALLCADAAYEKKAEAIVVLDVERILAIASRFVIATAASRKQLQAVADAIQEKLRPLGYRRRGVEGYEEGRWILCDYGDVVVHILTPEARRFYDLESVWGDAPRVPWKPPAPAAAGAAKA
jgi:ribosome-associated protein